MSNEPQQKDVFLNLKNTLEQDLESTGFTVDDSPPGEEPKIRGDLQSLSIESIKEKYDQFMAYYEYVTDEITRLLGYTAITKARMELAHASAVKKAHANKELTNAEIRKAWVTSESEYVEAHRDHLYFKTMLNMQEERRKKFSKAMDRLGREMWFRNTGDTKKYADFEERSDQKMSGRNSNRASFGRGYKEIK